MSNIKSAFVLAILVLLTTFTSAFAGPTFTVSPTSLSFTKDYNTLRVKKLVTITKVGSGTLSWKVRGLAYWLSPTPRTGTNSGSFYVYAGVSGQAVGTYTGSIEISAVGAPTVIIPVTLKVTGTAPAPEPEPEPAPEPTPTTINVPVGGNLQDALDSVTGGGTIRLVPGVTYWCACVLRPNSGTKITITTETTLPAAGTRITDSYVPNLAIIQSTSSEPAIRTSTGANNYAFVGVRFQENQGGAGEIIRLGDATDSNRANIPHHFTFDRVKIDVDPNIGQKRGIAANADYVTIINSDIGGMWRLGQDSQAISQWQANGHLVVRNNKLGAGSEIVMIGGAVPAVPGLNPDNILIENNWFTRPLSWKGDSKYVVKNLFELKAGTHVTVRHNLFENHWAAAQAGPSIVLTPKAGMRVTDVIFENNIIRNVGTGFNILGYDYYDPYDRSQGPQLERVAIRNNLFIFNPSLYGGNGRFITVSDGANNFTIDNNTVVYEGTSTPYGFLYGYDDPSGVTGWTVTDNIVFCGKYGVMAAGLAEGNASLGTYFHLTSAFTGNVLYGASASLYPTGNFYPTVAAMQLEFVNPAARDYRLKVGSIYTGKGVNFSLLPQ